MKQFAFKRLVLAAVALMTVGSMSAQTETYDFEDMVSSFSDTNEHYPTFSGTRIYNYQDGSWTDIEEISYDGFELNHRFAAEERTSASFNFRKAGSGWNGLNSGTNYARRFAILGLNVDDKVTIYYNQGNLYCYANSSYGTTGRGVVTGAADLADNDAITSGTEYTVKTAGRFDIITGTAKANITKIVIKKPTEMVTIGATTESYNFAAIASGASFTETGAASTTIALATTDNDFNNRFSLGTDSRNIAFKGAGYGLQLIYANRGLFINNLKAGDEVKITYTNEGSQVFKFVNGGNVGEAATATVTSDAWYTVETDGQLQMINTTNAGSDKTNITAVEIRTFKAATTATTLVCSKALDFSGTDVEAYIATSTTTSAVTLTQVNKVAPNTPLWIKADEGGYYQIPLLYDTADDTYGNMLLAGTGAKVTAPANHTYYVYGTPAGGTAGFYKVGTGGITVPTGKAYLDVAATGAPNFLNISFGEDFGQTTSLTEMEDKRNAESGVFYNLSGQRVAQPAKGLYIVNGKKVVIK